jgi:hypothetical protein
VARSMNIGCTTAPRGTRNCPLSAVPPRLPGPGTILDQPNMPTV